MFRISTLSQKLEFLFTLWRFWRLIAISDIFAKYAIFAKIATFQRAPLASHLNFFLAENENRELQTRI